MQYIYRIETPDQQGPYNNTISQGYILREALDYTQGSYTHPGMWADCSVWGLLANYSEYYCGFSTIESLYAWFTDQALQACAAFNMQVSIYTCDESFVLNGTFQVAFVLKHATCVDMLSIADVISLRS